MQTPSATSAGHAYPRSLLRPFMGRFFTHVSVPHRLQNFSPLNDSDQYHNDCDDEQNMNESSHRVTAHQPQQPQNYQNHSDCPKHSNPPLLYEASPHVHTFNPAAYPFPKGRGFNSLTVQAPTSSIAVHSRYPRNQQCGKLLCNERPTEKVALPFFAMLRLQEGQLRLFLHAFGYHPLFKAGAHGNYGADDDAIAIRGTNSPCLRVRRPGLQTRLVPPLC